MTLTQPSPKPLTGPAVQMPAFSLWCLASTYLESWRLPWNGKALLALEDLSETNR
jgi:hypothetical protein